MPTQSQLILPALRAKMGDWTYYVTVIKMSDFAERVQLAKDIHPNEALHELMQRSLDTRHSEKIKDFLMYDPQRLFNAMVVGVYGGQPQWLELQISPNEFAESIPGYVEQSVGILVLSGSEALYAIDGQHRLRGIKKAIKAKPELGEEQVSAIFVSHKRTEEGLLRTRRLFSRLNRYAKPVTTYDKIALDEDDIIAIIVRRLVESHPLFKGHKVSSSRSNSIGDADKRSFASLVFIYKSLDIFLKVSKRELLQMHHALDIVSDADIIKSWTEFKHFRPDEKILNYFFDKSTKLWDEMVRFFPPLTQYSVQPDDSPNASQYRHTNGGHVLFRPVGMEIVVRVIRHLIDAGISLDDAVRNVSLVQRQD